MYPVDALALHVCAGETDSTRVWVRATLGQRWRLAL